MSDSRMVSVVTYIKIVLGFAANSVLNCNCSFLFINTFTTCIRLASQLARNFTI